MGRSTHHVGVFCVGWLFQLGATSPAAVAGAGVAPGSRPRSVAVRAAVVLGRSNRTWAGDTCYHVSGYYELQHLTLHASHTTQLGKCTVARNESQKTVYFCIT